MIVGAPSEVRTSPTPLPLVFVVVVVGHRREETFSAPAAVACAAETCRIIQVGKCDKQVSIRALFAIEAGDGRGRGENIGAGEENNATKG